MAISSLSKFTVPLAGTGLSNKVEGTLMPKLKYRFRVMFENFGVSGSTTELTKQVSEAARPNVQFDNQEIYVYNSRINYAGRPKWQTITVKLRDDVTGAVTKLVGEQLQKQYNFFEQSSAAAGGDYKFLMRIEMLDGGNGGHEVKVLETWECYGCYVTQANYGGVAYTGQELLTIDLTIQPDNCIQTSGGSDGSKVARGNTSTLATNVAQGAG